jgi:hypothetical protein
MKYSPTRRLSDPGIKMALDPGSATLEIEIRCTEPSYWAVQYYTKTYYSICHPFGVNSKRIFSSFYVYPVAHRDTKNFYIFRPAKYMTLVAHIPYGTLPPYPLL